MTCRRCVYLEGVLEILYEKIVRKYCKHLTLNHFYTCEDCMAKLLNVLNKNLVNACAYITIAIQ